MDKILLFAGTTEGRNLAEFLEKNQIPTEVCVATQYGRDALRRRESIFMSTPEDWTKQRWSSRSKSSRSRWS